jgi:predicted GNAT family acetyltransferase
MNFQFDAHRIFSVDEHGKLLAEITFPARDPHSVTIDHTFVHESLRGQGIASHLMELAYAYLKRQDQKIVATCSYAVDWFVKHPEKQDIVLEMTPRCRL